jgi:hypothetical protein
MKAITAHQTLLIQLNVHPHCSRSIVQVAEHICNILLNLLLSSIHCWKFWCRSIKDQSKKTAFGAVHLSKGIRSVDSAKNSGVDSTNNHFVVSFRLRFLTAWHCKNMQFHGKINISTNIGSFGTKKDTALISNQPTS